LLFLVDVEYDSGLRYISFIFLAVIIFWGMTTHKNNNLGGFMSYGQAFVVGFFIVLISTVISSVYSYFYFVVIDPGIAEEVLINTEEQMLEQNPSMSDEQLDQALSMTEMFVSPVAMTLMGLIMGTFFGTILSLIIAIFAKKDKPLAA
jgi:ABC-type phosphate/phosphonate transport system permease subunit